MFINFEKNNNMKIRFLTLIMTAALFSCNKEDNVQSVDQLSTTNPQEAQLFVRGECRFEKTLNYKLTTDPVFAANYEANEAHIADYVSRFEADSETARRNLETLTIRVVVNNIYRNNPLPMDLIEGQIEQLNNAFSGRLERVPGIPANGGRFNARDTRIRFVLDEVKFRRNQKIFENNTDLYRRSTGGINPTKRNTRINIYVADIIVASNFENIIFGDSAFPGDAQDAFDHIYVDQLAFGVRPGNGFANEGKLLAHEMGHYFGLFHLPGRITELCSFDDAVGDTPNCTSNNGASDLVPGPTTTTCGSQDMYWNLMTDADDAQKFMFTNGQRNRMRGALDGGARSNFVRR